MGKKYQRYLLGYSFLVTLILVSATAWLAYKIKTGFTINELTAQRIKIEEPDGTLRMVLSNHDRFPGIIVKGKEEKFDRPQAGMLFFNDEGSENGGLIFSGYMDKDGKIKNSGGSLTFDRYGGNQELQLIGVNDSDYAFTGLIVRESPPNEQGYRRLWLGKDNEGTASLALKDALGNNRILLEVKKNGEASILFLDEQGNVTKSLTP